MSVSLMGKYHPWIERVYTVRLRINRESRKVGGRDIEERRQIGKASWPPGKELVRKVASYREKNW